MAATGTPTPNIGLRIPQGTDPASVDDINYNSNLLDTKLGAVGNESVQDQIDSLNGKVGHTTTITATTLADLKTNLLNAVNGVNSGDMIAVRITPSFSSDGFASGTTYGGYAYNIYKSGNTTSYFSAMISNNVGDGMRIGYSNGTWYFKTFQ